MSETLKQFQSILNDHSVIQALSQVHSEFANKYKEASKIYGSDASEFNLEILRKELRFQNPADHFHDLVLSRLDRPWVITAEELGHTFTQHVLLERKVPFDEAYKRFCFSAFTEANVLRTSAPIATLTYDAEWFDLTFAVNEFLFSNNDSFQVYIAGCLPAEEESFDFEISNGLEVVYIILRGRFSKSAIEKAVSEVMDVTTSLLKSIYKLELAQLHLPDYEEQKSKDDDNADDKLDALEKKAQTIVEESFDYTANFNAKSLAELRELLGAFYNLRRSQSELTSRIRNAIQLLVQADKQTHNAIAFALSVVSVETLLVDDERNVSQKFCENVALLLEPDPVMRPQAERFAKSLYRLRSEVFHGAKTDVSSSELTKARLLAAAVLRAFIERRIALRRYEEVRREETLSEFMESLHNMKYVKGQPMWIEESAISVEWRNSK